MSPDAGSDPSVVLKSCITAKLFPAASILKTVPTLLAPPSVVVPYRKPSPGFWRSGALGPAPSGESKLCTAR